MNLFSAPKPKAMVIVRRSSWSFNIFDFFFGRYSNLIWSKISTSSTKFVIFFRADRKSNIAVLASYLLRHFRFFFLKPLNGIQRNLTGRKISTSSTKFVFFKSIENQIWPSWSLIGWDIFDFFSVSETAERNTNETWQEATSQRSLSSLRFSGGSEIQDSRIGL